MHLDKCVRQARQNAGFGYSRVVFVPLNSGYRNALVTEGTQQQAPRLVIAENTDRKHVDAEVGKIIDRIGSASRNNRALTMGQNKHRRLARHARNFAENEFVRDHVSEHGDGDARKGFNNLPQMLSFFGRAMHIQSSRILCCRNFLMTMLCAL